MKKNLCVLVVFVVVVGFLSASFAQDTHAVAEKFKCFYGENGYWKGLMTSNLMRQITRDDVNIHIKSINEKGEVLATRQIGKYTEELSGLAGENGVIKIGDWELTLTEGKLKCTDYTHNNNRTTASVELQPVKKHTDGGQ